jgi:hypothetical protein
VKKPIAAAAVLVAVAAAAALSLTRGAGAGPDPYAGAYPLFTPAPTASPAPT